MKFWIAGLCTASFFYGLIQQAPANKLLPHFLPPESGLNAYEVEGGLLQGRIGQLNIQQHSINDVSWQLKPWHLLTGKLAADIEARPQDSWLSGRIKASLNNTFTLQDFRASSSLEALKPYLKIPFLPVNGQISVNLETATIEANKATELAGRISLGNAHWTLGRPHAALGDFHINLLTEEKDIIAQLDDSAANLSLSGEARLSADGAYALDAKIKPKAETPAAVANNMKTLGRTDSQGWYTLTYKGQLPTL